MQDVLTAIAKAKGLVRKLGKNDKNQHDGYKFASIDAFLEMVNPITAECGLITHLDEESVEEFDKRGRNGDTPWLRTTYLITVYHVSGQSLPPVRRRVEILRNGAQAFGSSQSYVLKQFYRGLLEIPTGDGDDADHRATDASPVRRAQARTVSRTPHDPQTGEVYDTPPQTPEPRNPAQAASDGLQDAWLDAIRDNLPPNYTPRMLYEGISEALITAFSAKKSEAGVKAQWEKRAKLINEMESIAPDAYANTLDAYMGALRRFHESEDHVGSEFGLPPVKGGASA